jgi:hypothetical protein
VTDVLATTRCPQCVALVRPGQPWCTLCHADLRPAPEPAAEAPQAALPVALTSAALTSGVSPTAADPLTDPLPVASGVPSGKHARHAAAGPDAAAEAVVATAHTGPSEREIDAMLAQLAAQTDPPLGGLGKRFDSRGAKVALAVGVGAGALVLLLLGAVILTAVFG